MIHARKTRLVLAAVAPVAVLFLITVVLLSGQALAQSPQYWMKSYGGSSGDVARSVQETSDGYIVAGVTVCFGEGIEVWLLKLQQNGAIPGCSLGMDSSANITSTNATITNTTGPVANTTATTGDINATVLNTDCSTEMQCSYSPPVSTASVGGHVMPVSKFEVLAPWIGLAGLVVLTTAVIVVRKRMSLL